MRKFGLIGYPLTHSFSCKYFTEKFSKEQIADCSYQNYPLQHMDMLAALLKDNPDLEGLNVTIPYKQSVYPFLRELDATAGAVGAVNCIDLRGGRLRGFNTDVTGFELSLTPLLKDFHDHALILGTGGASRAVAYVLAKLGIHYHFVSRKASDGALSYDQLGESTMAENTIVINTTPLGTSPDIHSAPDIPYQYLSSRHLLYDLVYNPGETLFLQKGKARGAVIKNGYQMLVLQAEASWEIWNRPLK